jgi:hypothetical protein
MTIPIERTQSVLRTSRLLLELASRPEGVDPRMLPLRAESLLRHFPASGDFALSSRALPLIWADPNRTRPYE